jgi:hypothetical protein
MHTNVANHVNALAGRMTVWYWVRSCIVCVCVWVRDVIDNIIVCGVARPKLGLLQRYGSIVHHLKKFHDTV